MLPLLAEKLAENVVFVVLAGGKEHRKASGERLFLPHKCMQSRAGLIY